MSTQQQQKYEQRPTEQDNYAIWTVGTDGRQYFNYVKAISATKPEEQIVIDLGLLNKCTQALKNEFPEVDDPNKQESQNAFEYDGETFSISQFRGQTLIYKGAAKYPSKTLATLPGSKPKSESKEGTQTTFSSGNKSNWKGKGSGSGGGYSNWNKGGGSNSTFTGLQDVQIVTLVEVAKLCTAESGLVFPPQDKYPPIYEDNVQKVIIGKPAMR